MPHSATRYLSRACRRSARLPWSRKIAATMRTASTACSAGDEAERLGEPGGGVGLVVGHAEPAAHQQVEAADLSAVCTIATSPTSCDQMSTQLSVERRDAGLELPRQVDVAVERLLLLGGDLLLAVEPDLVIRPGAGAQLARRCRGPPRAPRRAPASSSGAGQPITLRLDVAAGRQRRHAAG